LTVNARALGQAVALFSIAVVAAALSGCESTYERHHLVCAQYGAHQITTTTAMERLQLTDAHTAMVSKAEMIDEYCDALD